MSSSEKYPVDTPTSGMVLEETPLLVATGLSKQYPGVRALDDVTLTIGSGEVVGLLGENGAGKSTLLNLLSGVEAPDAGEISLQGSPYAPGNYSEANRLGVFRVFQHQALSPTLRVYENMYLSHESHFSRAGLVSHRGMRHRAQQLLEETGHPHIDPNGFTGELPYSTRQIIEVLKAIAVARLLEIETPVILLDEPTSALEQHEVRFLFSLIDRLREQAGFAFVSHRLHEVLEICSRVEVLRDGAHSGSFQVDADLTAEELQRAMVGREVAAVGNLRDGRRHPHQADVVLSVSGISREGKFEDVSFELRTGEVLGIGGLLGSGKGALARCLFERNWDEGRVHGRGRLVDPESGVRGSIASGIAFVPEDRHESGIILDFPLDWNMSLPAFSEGGFFLEVREEREESTRYMNTLGVKAQSRRALARTLSGGNQQKVVLGKWLMAGADIFILENPTFGIDVKARAEIYELFSGLAQQGAAILLISDELTELLALSDRVLVMRDGRLVAEHDLRDGDVPSEELLINEMAVSGQIGDESKPAWEPNDDSAKTEEI